MKFLGVAKVNDEIFMVTEFVEKGGLDKLLQEDPTNFTTDDLILM